MRRNPFVVEGCCRKGSRNALQELYNPTQVGGQRSFHSISHSVSVLFRLAPFSPSGFESSPISHRTLAGSRLQIHLQSFSERGQATKGQGWGSPLLPLLKDRGREKKKKTVNKVSSVSRKNVSRVSSIRRPTRAQLQPLGLHSTSLFYIKRSSWDNGPKTTWHLVKLHVCQCGIKAYHGSQIKWPSDLSGQFVLRSDEESVSDRDGKRWLRARWVDQHNDGFQMGGKKEVIK